MPGDNISARVEKITRFGIWMLIKGKEYFLPYTEFPYFHHLPRRAIQNVRLLHGFHLHWPDLDVDLDIDNLENPQNFPLRDKLASATVSPES